MGMYNSQAQDRKQEENGKPHRMPTGILHEMFPPRMFIIDISNIGAIKFTEESYATY
jgi:hypothetical protein